MILKTEKPKNEKEHPSQLTWLEYVIGKVEETLTKKAKAGDTISVVNVFPSLQTI